MLCKNTRKSHVNPSDEESTEIPTNSPRTRWVDDWRLADSIGFSQSLWSITSSSPMGGSSSSNFFWCRDATKSHTKKIIKTLDKQQCTPLSRNCRLDSKKPKLEELGNHGFVPGNGMWTDHTFPFFQFLQVAPPKVSKRYTKRPTVNKALSGWSSILQHKNWDNPTSLKQTASKSCGVKLFFWFFRTFFFYFLGGGCVGSNMVA